MKLSLMTFMCELPLLLEGSWSEEKEGVVRKMLHDAAERRSRCLTISEK